MGWPSYTEDIQGAHEDSEHSGVSQNASQHLPNGKGYPIPTRQGQPLVPENAKAEVLPELQVSPEILQRIDALVAHEVRCALDSGLKGIRKEMRDTNICLRRLEAMHKEQRERAQLREQTQQLEQLQKSIATLAKYVRQCEAKDMPKIEDKINELNRKIGRILGVPVAVPVRKARRRRKARRKVLTPILSYKSAGELP